MANFEVDGTVSFEVVLEVNAVSPEAAEKKAKELIADMYSLDAHGAYHNPKSVEYRLYSSDEIEG